MSTTNILDLNNRIDALEKIFHNVEPIQQQIDELKAWTYSGTKDASGNPITLTDGSARNAEGLAVTLEPIQSGSGTPSPENVRPITGYTECVVDDHGENFFANLTKDTSKGYIDNYYLTSDGSTSQSGGYYVSEYLEIKPNTVYYIGGISGNAPALCYYDSNKTYISSVQYANQESITDTSPSNAKYMRLSVLKANESLYMVRYASAIDTATIAFGQTVYGGSVDFKTGKVTVTHASIASYNGETINEPWLSSIDEYVSGTTPTTGAQVVYPLTTPIELTLTPAELELLKGYNYITSNGHNIELTYLPDTLKADILLTVSQLYGSKISIMDGILTGGTTGQVLTKTSDDNYAATWETLPATRTTTKK